jgi:hypothetical protein
MSICDPGAGEGSGRLSIVAGEATMPRRPAGRRVSEITVGNWNRQLLDGGPADSEAGGRPGANFAACSADEVEDLEACAG